MLIFANFIGKLPCNEWKVEGLRGISEFNGAGENISDYNFDSALEILNRLGEP